MPWVVAPRLRVHGRTRELLVGGDLGYVFGCLDHHGVDGPRTVDRVQEARTLREALDHLEDAVPPRGVFERLGELRIVDLGVDVCPYPEIDLAALVREEADLELERVLRVVDLERREEE